MLGIKSADYSNVNVVSYLSAVYWGFELSNDRSGWIPTAAFSKLWQTKQGISELRGTCDVIRHFFIIMHFWHHCLLWWHILSYLRDGEESFNKFLSPDHLRGGPSHMYSCVNRSNSFWVMHTDKQTNKQTYSNPLLERSNYNRANVWLCGNRLLERLMSTSPKSRYVRVSIIMNRSFFSYFWHSYFLRYGHFVEYMNMHAMHMWLTDAATVVVGADWTLHPWRHKHVGGVTAG